MATRRAVANGNWSATGTWNGGVVPGNGDTVYSNGFNVTLDVDVLIGGDNNPTVATGSLVAGQLYEIVNVGGQNWTAIGATSNTTGTVFLATGTGTAGNLGTAKALATLTTATNTAAGATTGGGSFVMSTIRAMTCDLRAGTTACLNVTATTGTLVLSGIRVIGGTASGAHGVSNNTQSTVQSCVLTGGAGASSHALNQVSASNVTISSSVLSGGTVTGATAVNNSNTGTITFSDSTFTGGNGLGRYAVNNSSTGNIVIFGGTLIGSADMGAVNNASTGSVTISGATITAGAGAAAAALNNASFGSVTVTNSTFTASAFTNAVNIANTAVNVRLSGDFLDHWSGWKAVNGGKWSLGTAPTAARTRYALAGTTDSYVEMFTADNTGFGLPAATDVRSGISYGGGAVTGTCAVPSPSAVAFSVPVDNTMGTAVLTPAAIRAELATELGRIDAAISSRLAPSGTLATVTNLTNAPASVTPADIWSHPTRTITGGTVDTLTNAPTVPSASAIASQVRTELTTELGRIDAAISTRATPANIPTSDITAIKAKTDALNTTRLGQVATTEILGNLLAQANS
jgi:trimeric autotransporter adhesin